VQTAAVIIAICVALRRQHPEHCVCFWSPQRKRGSEELNFVQQRVTDKISALQQKACKERLGDEGLVQQREVEGGVFIYLTTGRQNQPLLRGAQKQPTYNEHKLQQVKFQIDVRKKCFTLKGSGSGAQKTCGTSIFADTPHLTRKGPEQPGLTLDLSLAEQWVEPEIPSRSVDTHF